MKLDSMAIFLWNKMGVLTYLIMSGSVPVRDLRWLDVTAFQAMGAKGSKGDC